MTNFDKTVERKNTYSTQWDYIKDIFGKDDLLPFGIADMDFQSPSVILKALEERVSHGIFGYARGRHLDYLNAISNWYHKRFNFQLDKDWIIFSPAVIYSIHKILTIINPDKKNICIFTPCYNGFAKMLKSNNYPFLTSSIERYNIENDFEKKISQSKVLIITNPNNPNGKLWNKEELEFIINTCKKYNVYIISDDVHMDIVYQEKRIIPILKIAKDLDYLDNCLIITSINKSFNSAALGGAYAIIPNKNIFEKFQNILQNQDSISSSLIFSVIATIAGYQSGEKWLQQLNQYCYNNLNYVNNYLQENMPNITMKIPDATYFAWLDCSLLNISSKEIQEKLINKGKVALFNGDYFLSDTPHLRLNIACPLSKLQEGLVRIKKSLA